MLLEPFSIHVEDGRWNLHTTHTPSAEWLRRVWSSSFNGFKPWGSWHSRRFIVAVFLNIGCVQRLTEHRVAQGSPKLDQVAVTHQNVVKAKLSVFIRVPHQSVASGEGKHGDGCKHFVEPTPDHAGVVAELEGQHASTGDRTQQLVEVHFAKGRVLHDVLNDGTGHVDPAGLFDAFESG